MTADILRPVYDQTEGEMALSVLKSPRDWLMT